MKTLLNIRVLLSLCANFVAFLNVLPFHCIDRWCFNNFINRIFTLFLRDNLVIFFMFYLVGVPTLYHFTTFLRFPP